MPSITVSEIRPTKNAKPVIAIPQPMIVNLLYIRTRLGFFNRFSIKSFMVDADSEFSAEFRLDIAAASREANINPRTPGGNYSKMNFGIR